MDIVQSINNQRLSWFDYVVGMEAYVPAGWVFNASISVNRRKCRPCFCRKDQTEEALSSNGVTNSRGAWKDVLKQPVIKKKRVVNVQLSSKYTERETRL